MRQFLFCLCQLLSVSTFAQQWNSLSSNTPAPPQLSATNTTNGGIQLSFYLPGYWSDEIQIEGNPYQLISFEGAVRTLVTGAPDLPRMVASVQIPAAGTTKIHILSAQYQDFPATDVVPSKGNLLRTQDPATVPYTFGIEYQKNAFLPGELVTAGIPYIFRDYRGQALDIHPVVYNPVTHTVRVYTHIDAELRPAGGTSINELSGIRNPITDNEFSLLYQQLFLNHRSSGKVTYTPVGESGSMLIICAPAYLSAIQPFVKWKKLKGLQVELVSTAVTGTTEASIKAYINSYYSTTQLKYVLLVGDHGDVPACLTTYGYSDVWYGCLVGTDYYPEVFVGRFSGDSVADIDIQVKRSVLYEKYPQLTGTGYQTSLGIASDQGPGDDGELDYEHIRNIRAKILSYLYTSVGEMYDGSQGGLDASGDPTPGMVGSFVDGGTGMICYTGHGSSGSWGSSGFSSGDVNALSNTNFWPFIISVACVNGDFTSSTCFAEAWLRAHQGSNPTGAVATLMSTINQSWNPPMEGQDEMVDILIESYTSNIKRTFGGIAMNGCMKMNDTYAAYDMTATWTTFGDPSVVVRTTTPTIITATHPASMPIGTPSVSISCPRNGAQVCLNQSGEIVSTGTVSGGLCNMSFAPISTTDTVYVTITDYNGAPYLGYILITPSSSPFIVYTSHTVLDPAPGGNVNGLADYSEDISLDVTLTNFGALNAPSVNAVMSTSDPYIILTDNTEVFGLITAGGAKTATAGYSLSLPAFVPDQHLSTLTLNITDGSGGAFTAPFNLLLNAPVADASILSASDVGGDNDGSYEPGEILTLTIGNGNTGHATFVTPTGILSVVSGPATVVSGTVTPGTLLPGGSAGAACTIQVLPGAVLGSIVKVRYVLSDGVYADSVELDIVIGRAIEDWETGTITKFPWSAGTSNPWFITSASPYEGTYCLQSGAIPDNGVTSFSLTTTTLIADSLSFYYKVSSEDGWDFLHFKLDGTTTNSWSGELPWARIAYFLPAGTYVFEWSYEKDAVYNAGSDAAWVDFIMLPPNSITTWIEQSGATTGLEVYPNPAFGTGHVNIVSDVAETAHIQLISVTGVALPSVGGKYELQPGQNDIRIRLDGIPAGVYLLQVTINGAATTHSWVIQ